MTGVLSLYKEWLATATPEQIKLVDAVYAIASLHYSGGGDVIVETMEPADVLREFGDAPDLDAAVKAYAGVWVEQNLNAREGTDDDPQLRMAREHDEW